jgi:putative membrane protein insertion efficiency factor
VSAVSPVAATGSRPASPLARPLLATIRLYQLVIAGRPSPCRFEPSCSTYAMEALQLHGAVRGGLLAFRRLGRCHPWGGQGYDPVPEKKAPR